MLFTVFVITDVTLSALIKMKDTMGRANHILLLM